MKKYINLMLSIFSPLAAVPTGWAIFAGVTEQPAFPMNSIAAAVGAIAVIATSIQAGLLITDIKAYNQGLKLKAEQTDFGMSIIPAWLIFGGCTLAEIVLSLLIVVIPGALAFGVLVFPLMTAAGVFAFAVRFDLQSREAELEQARLSAKKQKELAKSEAKPKGKPATKPLEPEPSQLEPKYFCKVAGCSGNPKTPDGSFGSQSALNAHGGKHKPIAFSVSLIEPVMAERQK